MPAEHRTIPGIDREGFVPMETLRARAQRTPEADFVSVFSAPALHVIALVEDKPIGPGASGPSGSRQDDTERSFKRTVFAEKTQPDDPTPSSTSNTSRLRGLSGARYHDRVAFLVKRPGNPFPKMISLGRAMNNDVVVVLETISKMHGYFLSEGDHWSFCDNRSTNGSCVNNERLQPGEKRLLADGDILRLGLEVQATLLMPQTLYRRLIDG